MSNFALETDKCYVVAGGSGLIGSQICVEISKAGGIPVVLDKISPTISGVEHFFELNNYTSDFYIKKIVKEVQKNIGKVKGLVNCISVKASSLESYFADFEEYDLSEWSTVLMGNLNYSFLLGREFGKVLGENAGGSIILFGSIYGAEFGPDFRIYSGLNSKMTTPVPYAVSKGGIEALTRYLATALASNGVRVNSVCPGGVFNHQDEKFVANYSQRVPMGRMANPEEIAKLPVFLLSENASYITGQSIYVDGGLSAW